MKNCHNHHHRHTHSGCHGSDECNGRRKHCGHSHGSCGSGKGKKRELFIQKYTEYLRSVNLPDFENEEDYKEWLMNTGEGKQHLENIEKINEEVDNEYPWGGKRENSGRKKLCIRKIPYTRRISAEVLEKLKQYSQENGITETVALEKAIEKLYS